VVLGAPFLGLWYSWLAIALPLYFKRVDFDPFRKE